MINNFEKVQEICDDLAINKEQLLAIKDQMKSEIKRALRNEPQNAGCVKCWPTYIQNYPNGCEHGKFLVAELCISTICISLVHLKGDYEPYVVTTQYPVEEEHLETENMEIFDYMAQCLLQFLRKHRLHRDPLGLAVTFCFPIQQTSLTNASLTEFTACYRFRDDESVDLGEIIREALKRRLLQVQLVALLSDATGVLLASFRRNQKCRIGFVSGLRMSVSYVEKTKNMELSDELNMHSTMIVNADWGVFSENAALENVRNVVDRQVDENSPNPGERLFEKMTSSQYVAELARCIFLTCATKGWLFDGGFSKQLQVQFSLRARHVVLILADDVKTFKNTRLVFDKLGIKRPTIEDCLKVHYIVECVIRRSAALVAAGIACLVEKVDANDVIVAVAGSFYASIPVYHECIYKSLQVLVKEGKTFALQYNHDAIARGAAYLVSIILRKEFLLDVGSIVGEMN